VEMGLRDSGGGLPGKVTTKGWILSGGDGELYENGAQSKKIRPRGDSSNQGWTPIKKRVQTLTIHSGTRQEKQSLASLPADIEGKTKKGRA